MTVMARRAVLTAGLITSAAVGTVIGWAIGEITRPVQMSTRLTEGKNR